MDLSLSLSLCISMCLFSILSSTFSWVPSSYLSIHVFLYTHLSSLLAPYPVIHLTNHLWLLPCLTCVSSYTIHICLFAAHPRVSADHLSVKWRQTSDGSIWISLLHFTLKITGAKDHKNQKVKMTKTQPYLFLFKIRKNVQNWPDYLFYNGYQDFLNVMLFREYYYFN